MSEAATGAPRPDWRPDWQALLERRARLLAEHTELPPFLVLPEIRALLAAASLDRDRMLVDLLWHTGARVSEALAFTRASFVAYEGTTFARIATLKRRGRPKKRARYAERLVPLTDPAFLAALERFIDNHAPSGPLFPVTRQTVRHRIGRLAEAAALPISCTPHTLRHSFAINCLLHGIPLKILQTWLGHRDPASTQVYARVLDEDTTHFMRAVRYA